MTDLWLDLRQAIRHCRRAPVMAAVIVGSLTLGIGANTAVFSFVNAIQFRPLPVADERTLVDVSEWSATELCAGCGVGTSYPGFLEWRERSRSFSAIGAYKEAAYAISGAGEPARTGGALVSAGLFPMLGVHPVSGRGIAPDDERPAAAPVVLISDLLWRNRFGSRRDVLGETLKIDGHAHTIIGIMPPGFRWPEFAQLWRPLGPGAVNWPRTDRSLTVVARLAPDSDLQRAATEVRALASAQAAANPVTNARWTTQVTSLRAGMTGETAVASAVFLSAVGFVLLIACANVANLLLARAAVRQKEIAVRVALGARRWRLIRQFLTESVLLSTLGGLVGLAIAFGGLVLLKAFIPENISQTREISIDLRVLGFTFLVSIATGLIFGLAPAVQAARFNQIDTLKEGGRDAATGGAGKRLRGLLVMAEVAISLVLLIGAGLLINSFLRLRNVDPGFRADNLLTMRVVLPDVKYETMDRRSAFYTDLINRVQSLAGVRSAAVTTNLPLYRQGNSISIGIEGRPAPPPGQELIVVTRIVSPGYFDTMSIPLLQGRQLSEQDAKTTPRVVVISETMGRRYWPGEDVVGKRISLGRIRKPEDWFQVVGVVKDVRQFELTAEPKPQMYLTYRQAGFFDARDLVVKTDVEPASMAATVRNAVWELDKDQPVSNIQTMEEILADSIARQRFSMLLLAIFAAVALVLAGVGIYGVMSYSVAQRTHEIGIRMALGAQTGAVLKLAVGYGMKLVLAGLVIGLIAAFALTRVMSTLLFGVTATDPATFTLISLLLIAVAVIASYIPARRATRVNPIIALRYE